MKTFAGKGAFITGAAGGFGLALARRLLARGMRVAIADIRADAVAQAHATLAAQADGERVFSFVVDVSDRARMAEVADEAERVLGKIHLLCNNAGIGVTGPIKEATFDDWDWMLGILLGGVINGVQLFLPKLRAHGEGGHILNTASMSGVMLSGNNGIYTTAKFGVVGMTESLRAELAADGIVASVFLAGPMETGLMWTHQLRPANLVTGYVQHDRERERIARRFERMAEAGKHVLMSADEAAARVVGGLERDDLYIIAHSEFAPGLRARAEALLRAVPKEAPPRGRVMLPELISNPIYATQGDVPAWTEDADGKRGDG